LIRAGHSSRGALPSVCVCVIVKSRKWGGPAPLGAVALRKKSPPYLTVHSRSKGLTDNFTPTKRTKNNIYSDRATNATYAVQKCLVYYGAVYTLILHCNCSLLTQFWEGGEGGGMEGGSQSYLRLFVSYSLRLCSIL